VASVLDLGPRVPGSIPSLGQNPLFHNPPRRFWIRMLNNEVRVVFSMEHAGANRKSPNDTPWVTLNQRHSNPMSANLIPVPWRRSGYLHISKIGRVPAEYLQVPVEYLRSTAGYTWGGPAVYLRIACIPLMLVRIGIRN